MSKVAVIAPMLRLDKTVTVLHCAQLCGQKRTGVLFHLPGTVVKVEFVQRIKHLPLSVRLGLTVAGLLYVVVMLFELLPQHVGPFISTTIHTVTVALAATLLLYTAKATTARVALSQRLIASALIIGALSGLFTVVWYALGGVADPVTQWLPLDTVYIFMIPVTLVAVLLFPVSTTSPGSVVSSVVDGALAGVGLWVCVYVLVVMPAQLSGALTDVVLLKTLAYPAADAAIIGVALSMIPRVSGRYRPQLLWFTGGLSLWALSDVAYIVGQVHGGYRSDSWVAVVAEVGLVMLCFGALSTPRDKTETLHRFSIASVALPFLPVVAAWAVLTWAVLVQEPLSTAALVAASITVALMLVRMVVGWSDRLRLVRQMQLSDQLYRALVTESFDTVAVLSIDGTPMYASPSLYTSLRTDEHEFAVLGPTEWLHPEDLPSVQEVFTDIATMPGAKTSITARVRVQGDKYRWSTMVLHNMVDDEAVGGIVVNGRDVHEHIELRDELAHAATHDALTGLGNLVAARQLLDAAHARGEDGNAVLVDLDGFKNVNDTYGHQVGDCVLVEVANRLRASVRDTDVVCRVGGDEFLLVLPHDVDSARVASRVVALARKPVIVNGIPLLVPASVGVAKMSQANTVDELLRDADLAMYAAKSAGKDQWETFSPWMHGDSVNVMAVATTLHQVLAGEGPAHLYTLYQPIINLRTGLCAGAEAFVHMRDSDGGDISSEAVLTVAEETGAIVPLHTLMLQKVCEDMTRHDNSGVGTGRVFLNVYRNQLGESFTKTFLTTLTSYGIDPARMGIDLTDSTVFADVDAAVASLRTLREAGVTVALDRFGTGGSPLEQLQQLPLDLVKIDSRFVSQGRWELLDGMVGLCASVGLPVVVEGVDSEETATRVSQLGAAFGQGLWFSTPVPASQTSSFFTA